MSDPLNGAQAALAAGRPGDALSLAEVAAAQFPSDLRAARLIATIRTTLCSMGKVPQPTTPLRHSSRGAAPISTTCGKSPFSRRSASDMTLKSVLKSALRRVDLPVDWEPKTEMRW